MTDNEIIKALKCCVEKHGNGTCCECPLYKRDGSCTTKLTRYTLDLIKRQKAEIEDLENEIDKQYEQAKADILGNMSDCGTSCHWCIDQHRAKAVKEFAERLKEKSFVHYNGFESNEDRVVKLVTVKDVDNLVKEMTEERNG